MPEQRNLGICMDHSSAHLIEFPSGPNKKDISISKPQLKADRPIRSEHVMHNQDQHQQSEYYKKLGESIKSYTHVLLFGPTQAKAELLNILEADHLFANIKMEVRQTDKMTENQEHAYVRDFFSTAL